MDFEKNENILKPKSPEQESPMLILPENIQVVLGLQKMLKDCRDQLIIEKESREYKDVYKSPQQRFSVIAETHYKIALIETLLLESSVSTYELSNKLGEQDKQFVLDYFEAACRDIDRFLKANPEDKSNLN